MAKAVVAVLAALVFVSVAWARPAAVPQNTKEPTISGAALVNKTLTGDRGTWSGGSLNYAYAWVRCDKQGANCASISGATQTKYTVVSADLGATIRFRVTASNSDGQKSADSNP